MDVAVVEVAAYLGCEDRLRAPPRQGRADQLLAVTVAVYVGRVEEIAAVVERGADGAERLGVVGGAVRVAVLVAAHGPAAEPDFADGETCAPEDAQVHWRRSRSSSVVAT